MAQIIEKREKDQTVRINELARKVGTDKSTVSRIMNGQVMPSLATAKKLADGMGVSLDDLYERLTA